MPTGHRVDAAAPSSQNLHDPEPIEADCAAVSDHAYDAVIEGKQSDIEPRLAAAAKKPTDPRVVELMLTILQNVPWTADSSKPLWRHVFSAVNASKSPRFVQEADALRAGFSVRPLMKTWLEGQLKKALVGLPTEGAWVAPAKKQKLAAAPGESALLAAVYAKPADDGPRQVYADFLIERGDPRGEFISLQLGGADPKRQKQLLKEHGKKWLGDIAPVVGADFEFRRGFLSRALAKFRHEADARKFGDLPEWSTVEELSWTGPYPRPFGQAPFIDYLGPTMISLKKANQPHGPSVLAAKTPWTTLEELHIELPPMDVIALLASKNFPKLHTLRFAGMVDESFFRNVKRIGAVKHFYAGVSVKEQAPALAALALQAGFETIELSGLRFDRATLPADAARPTQGLPPLGLVLAIGTRADGAVIVVDQQHIFVFDAGLTRLLEAWPTKKVDHAQVTPDGKTVISTTYRRLIGCDTTNGTARFDISNQAIGNEYRSQHALSADGRRLSVARDVVVDLKTNEELPRPRGSTNASFIDPDRQWWCMFGRESKWVLQRADAKTPFQLAASGLNERFSRGNGVLHFHRDSGLTAFDLVSGEQLGHLDGRSNLHAYSSDGATLALGRDDGIHLVDARTLTVKRQLKHTAFAAAFSPDGTSLIIARDGKLERHPS